MDPAIWPPLFTELPEALAAEYDLSAPWALLGEPLDRLFAALPGERIDTAVGPDVRLLGHHIVLGKGTRIAPGVVIEGPIYLGEDVLIRTGAYLHGGVWLEDGAVVGAHCEVERAIFLRGARAPHLSYVGDSILGAGVHLGAGTILSNRRHDGREIAIPLGERRIQTGRTRLGAVLGDRALTGGQTVLDPGCIVGRDTSILSGVQLPSGTYPAGSRIRVEQQIEITLAHPRGSRRPGDS